MAKQKLLVVTRLAYLYLEIDPSTKGKYKQDTTRGRDKIQKQFASMQRYRNIRPEYLQQAIREYESELKAETHAFLQEIKKDFKDKQRELKAKGKAPKQ